MSGIVLSSSVRQNLLSLQSTADLLATTQNRLATGKKVNTALDNPTNFFTAQSLDSRAGDINNLLDGIGNGVQVLQAANTGITSLQKLVDTAKSIANQALQSAVGYSTKSNVSATIAGATAADLRGTTATPATASANVLFRRGRRSDRCRCDYDAGGTASPVARSAATCATAPAAWPDWLVHTWRQTLDPAEQRCRRRRPDAIAPRVRARSDLTGRLRPADHRHRHALSASAHRHRTATRGAYRRLAAP